MINLSIGNLFFIFLFYAKLKVLITFYKNIQKIVSFLKKNCVLFIYLFRVDILLLRRDRICEEYRFVLSVNNRVYQKTVGMDHCLNNLICIRVYHYFHHCNFFLAVIALK